MGPSTKGMNIKGTVMTVALHVHGVFKDSSALPLLENFLFSCRQSSTLFDPGAGHCLQKGSPVLTA